MYTFFFFFLGTIFGSFLTVVVPRLHFGESGTLLGRSKSKDGRTLKPKELIPIFSFLIQKGKDSKTGEAIPRFYVLTELVLGLSFAFIYFFNPSFDFALVLKLIVITFWGALALYDLLYGLVDRRISLVFIVLLLVLTRDANTWLMGAIGGLWFMIPWIASKGKWVGEGDIDLGVAFGLTVGALGGWGLWVYGLLAYVFASLTAIILKLTTHQKKPITKLPMAPFLALSVLVFLLFGNFLVSAYKNITIGL